MYSLANTSIKYLFILLGIHVAVSTTTLPIGQDVLWYFISILLLISIFILKSFYYDKTLDTKTWALYLFLIWVFVSFLRGSLVADNYWDWKNLVRFSFTMLLPSIAFISTNKYFIQRILNFWLKYGLWLVFLFIPFIIFNDFYGQYLAPIMLLLLVFPLLSYKWKFIALFFALMVLSAGFDSRSNLIRFTMAISLGGIYYFPFLNKVFLLRMMHIVFMILPVLLLVLALTNVFNVFKMNEYLGKHTVTESGKKEKLTADTRTLIYVEVIKSALKHNYVIQGRTPAKGYDSVLFGAYKKYTLGIGKMVRYSSEVSVCNILTWYGMIGLILYFMIFLISTYLALYKSNNYFIKVIGVFVAFRWTYSFVEEFSNVDIQMAMLWVLIGMCYSSSIRAMNDEEFQRFIRSITPKIRL